MRAAVDANPLARRTLQHHPKANLFWAFALTTVAAPRFRRPLDGAAQTPLMPCRDGLLSSVFGRSKKLQLRRFRTAYPGCRSAARVNHG